MGLQQVKAKVDIETLLHWAFRDELPKKSIALFGPTYISPLARLIDMGTIIDETAGEPGFPAALGEPHPDALIIERAVLSLADVAIDWPGTRATAIGELGGLLDDDEPTLARLTIGCAGLVAMHAKLRSRPRVLFSECGPVIGANGKPAVQYLDERGRWADGRKGRHYGPCARCRLEWWPAPREAAFTRVEYSIWWQALDTLADHLQGALESHRPLSPAAHPSPWMTWSWRAPSCGRSCRSGSALPAIA